MYQGHPLLVVIVSTVMNSLVDVLSTRRNLRYYCSTSHQVNVLQYGDGTCLVNSPASCQYLLSLVSEWLSWSGMKAEVPKCQCILLATRLHREAGIDPHLKLDGIPIPFAKEPVKFLGLRVYKFQKIWNASRVPSCMTSLQTMLDRVDASPVTGHQKLILYIQGRSVPPDDLASPWWATHYLDRTKGQYHCYSVPEAWIGVSESANPAYLYLPRSMGGLGLPQLPTLHKTLQVSCQSQLLMHFQGPLHLTMAENNLQYDVHYVRKKFGPAVVVRDKFSDHPNHNRKSLAKAAKVATVWTAHFSNFGEACKAWLYSRAMNLHCASH